MRVVAQRVRRISFEVPLRPLLVFLRSHDMHLSLRVDSGSKGSRRGRAVRAARRRPVLLEGVSEGPQDTPYVGGVYELTFKFLAIRSSRRRSSSRASSGIQAYCRIRRVPRGPGRRIWFLLVLFISAMCV